MSGRVEAIFLTAEHGALPAPVDRVRARAGRGLEGNRYYWDDRAAPPGRAVTLIASEAVEAVASEGGIPYGTGAEVVTAVAADRLRELDRSLVTVPEKFTIHPKLKKQLDRRAEALEQGGIDWGQAESLAFASLLVEGIPIRLTGQDTERGTFSHRHDVLHDVETGEIYTPIQHLAEAQASFELFNSPQCADAWDRRQRSRREALPDRLGGM